MVPRSVLPLVLLHLARRDLALPTERKTELVVSHTPNEALGETNRSPGDASGTPTICHRTVLKYKSASSLQTRRIPPLVEEHVRPPTVRRSEVRCARGRSTSIIIRVPCVPSIRMPSTRDIMPRCRRLTMLTPMHHKASQVVADQLV